MVGDEEWRLVTDERRQTAAHGLGLTSLEEHMTRWWVLGVIWGLMIAGTASATEQAAPRPDIVEMQGAPMEAGMDLSRLGRILKRAAPDVKWQEGTWELVMEGTKVIVIADQDHNRMWVIAPVADAGQVTPEVLRRMMEANFTSALDVRYAIFQGMVWAAFLHPLDSLIEQELRSALNQVATLVKTTGTTYSSSGSSSGPKFGGSPVERNGDGKEEGKR